MLTSKLSHSTKEKLVVDQSPANSEHTPNNCLYEPHSSTDVWEALEQDIIEQEN